jgi:hypothetical protein
MEPEKLDGYGKSKVNAEKAAWDYVKELPGNLLYKNNYKYFTIPFVVIIQMPFTYVLLTTDHIWTNHTHYLLNCSCKKFPETTT